MCLIVDTCCIPSVFDPSSQDHARFAPVLRWITKGTGRLVVGGEKYRRELRKMTHYMKILGELQRRGRIVDVDNAQVNSVAADLRKRFQDPAFNDEHLAALVVVSRCRIVCTDDHVAVQYLTTRALYPAGVIVPKIYRHQKHKRMCCSKNIAAICND